MPGRLGARGPRAGPVGPGKSQPRSVGRARGARGSQLGAGSCEDALRRPTRRGRTHVTRTCPCGHLGEQLSRPSPAPAPDCWHLCRLDVLGTSGKRWPSRPCHGLVSLSALSSRAAPSPSGHTRLASSSRWLLCVCLFASPLPPLVGAAPAFPRGPGQPRVTSAPGPGCCHTCDSESAVPVRAQALPRPRVRPSTLPVLAAGGTRPRQ